MEKLSARRGAVIWLIGLSGAGKTTLAQRLCEKLTQMGLSGHRLDGDEIRQYFPHVGFSHQERLNHLSYIAFTSAQLEKSGQIVVGSLITPYEEARKFFRTMCQNYIEVWVDTDLSVCESRDSKGLYARARKGDIAHFTGVSDVFEKPTRPDVHLVTAGRNVEECFEELWEKIKDRL